MTAIKSAFDSVEKRIFKKANQLILDVVIFILSFFLSYIIRFEGVPSGLYLKQMLYLVPYIVLARILCFSLFSIYSIVWRYISIGDALSILKATLPVSLVVLAGRLVLPTTLPLLQPPLTVIALEFMFVLTGTLGLRMVRRLFHEMSEREHLGKSGDGKSRKRVLLVGAGNAGNMVLKELKQRTDLGVEVIGFIDDDPKKFNTVLQGVKVLGDTARIPEIVKKLNADEIIISIANAASKEIRRIVGIAEGSKVKVKIVPGLFEMLDDRVKISKIREIDINDLLGRSLVTFENNRPEVVDIYENKRIMITGAGGSIGSELCRQLAVLGPRELILLDKDENSIYEIDTELNRASYGFQVRPLIANLKNLDRLDKLFAKYRPDVVFHAAAHKHVPLMELNVAEAILNNVYGTRNAARLADKHGVERFIFISTDKAINPTSVMGASKKLGEIIIQGIAAESATRFSCVRFGNVLGSRGSVVPLFQKQLARGGPLTLTHPDIKRYFMSISEAVQLIIQAGTIGDKGEIFVLDMGEQIKIIDLAKDLIKLSGYGEDDIEIRYIGLRPGEKLYEEILVDEERAKATRFEKIYIAPPIETDRGDIDKKLDEIIEAARDGKEAAIISGFKEAGIGYVGNWKER